MNLYRVGLNPYGLTVRLGLQGAHPAPWSLDDFVAFAESLGVRALEIHGPHLEALPRDARRDLGLALRERDIWPVVAYGPDLGHLDQGIGLAEDVGANTLRLGLSSVLEGARAKMGDDWPRLVETVRGHLRRFAPLAEDRGIRFGIEDHQDFGSEELLAFCEEAGPNVGITFDTANPLSVGEDIVAFAERVAPRVVHVHLKDYVTTFTSEGYRLIRCPIGDGVVPLAKLNDVLGHRPELTVSVEIAALQARHIRVFCDDWWVGYPPRTREEFVRALRSVAEHQVPAGAEWQTPFEMGADPVDIGEWEIAQVRRSFANLRGLGWL